MKQTNHLYVTDMQRDFIDAHGRARYYLFVRMLLSFVSIEEIRREFGLSFGEVMVWRQIMSLQESYDAFESSTFIWESVGSVVRPA